MDASIWDQPLFLADDDDDNPPPAQPAPQHDVDLDAIFADDDDFENALASKPLPVLLDEEELTRQARANLKNRPPPTQYEITSSSPPRPEPDFSKSTDKRKDEKKARRRIVKLDESRLINPETGFPQLIKMTKDFKIKGKGHEETDLHRLLNHYQFWTHQLYPKTTFQDTVERVEKLCHSRRMNVALSVWRDEAHGKQPKEAEELEDEDEDGENERENTRETDDRLPPSSPPQSSPVRAPQPNTQKAAHVDDDEEDFWRSIDAGMAVDSGNLSEPPPSAPTTRPSSAIPPDDDEDMWDIVNDIEQQGSTGPPANALTAKPSEPEIAIGPLPQNHPTDDDDWDDMYA